MREYTPGCVSDSTLFPDACDVFDVFGVCDWFDGNSVLSGLGIAWEFDLEWGWELGRHSVSGLVHGEMQGFVGLCGVG